MTELLHPARVLQLAAVLVPPLAVLPFIQLGGGQDVQCGPLVQHAQAQIRAPAQPTQVVAAKR
jgi:hypothetical protein